MDRSVNFITRSKDVEMHQRLRRNVSSRLGVYHINTPATREAVCDGMSSATSSHLFPAGDGQIYSEGLPSDC